MIASKRFLCRVAMATALVATTLALSARPNAVAIRPAGPPGKPALIVLLVVDQFAADYIDLYSASWTKGLHRLLSEGAVFRNAAYPYANTITCPGHNTIGTGVLPNVHGMIANTWFDRAKNASVACTEDPTAISIAFGDAVGAEHHSPKNLLTSSMADQLREQSHDAAKIMSLSLKPRSAIGMAGHAGPNTMVVWLEDRGVFATSTAYTAAAWPEVDAYVRTHPIARDLNETWTRLLPEPAYKFDDDALGEAPPAGWGKTFPHALDRKSVV